jgi:hypothetical protein
VKICVYSASDQDKWDDFIAKSKNGTFLFFRDYMDYHSDRFRDHSLIISNEKGRIISLLPANTREDTLASHEGLTYGGFITDDRMTVPVMMDVFNNVTQYLTIRGFTRFIYKTIPHIYHSFPAEEDLYGLFCKNARLYRRDVLTVIDYRSNRLKFQQRRLRSIKKALRNHLQVRETDDYEQFWDILATNLYTKYRLKPVHSVAEIKLLAKRFPNEIRLVAAYRGDVMQAGAVVYLSRNVCHVQYNAASEDGKNAGALDLVIDHLVEFFSASKKYFDFGVSTEDNGRYLNVGLVEYKEGFGARTIMHDFYEIDLTPIVKERPPCLTQ